ncbi:AAA family ATPase [Sediminihabitans luteus]|nr:AAA family ATPase [Sediminihabitans luteus]
MLIWVNGPFEVGKTQTVHEIARRLPGSVVCDPEHIGFGLQRSTPPALRPDFQDFAAWRAGVVEVLDLALRGAGGDVVVPMTVTSPRYLDETVGRLRELGHDVGHVALLARRETVVRRLAGRGAGVGAIAARVGMTRVGLRREAWALEQLDRGLDALSAPVFAEHVVTDDRTVPEVADEIARLWGLALRPSTDGRLVGGLRRVVTSVRHIRR